MSAESTLDEGLTAVQRVAREVVAVRGTVATAVAVGGTFLIEHHVITPGVDQAANTVIGWVFAVAVFVAGLTWTRAGTTPADPRVAPKAKSGEPLVTATTAAQAVIAAVQAAQPSQQLPIGLTDDDVAAMDKAAAIALAQPDTPATEPPGDAIDQATPIGDAAQAATVTG